MSQQQSQTFATPNIAAPTLVDASSKVVVQALFAVMLGLFVVGLAGFSQIDAIHNAAHDTRHSNAFPCH